jgi:regulator of protease activity HflC (stomatin/prohibitin superfamily)
MAHKPDILTYEEHSLVGSTFPRPKRSLLYTPQRVILTPETIIAELKLERDAAGLIPLPTLSAALGTDLLMTLEELSSQNMTTRSPRLLTQEGQDLTVQLYTFFKNMQPYKKMFAGLLRI